MGAPLTTKKRIRSCNEGRANGELKWSSELYLNLSQLATQTVADD
jgi:hypothetical protein